MSFIKHLLPAWKQKMSGDSANAVILSSIDKALKEAELDTIEGKVVMELESSTGEWLNQYGDLFGPRRRDGEVDEVYRGRLIEYVKLKRGTIPAIKDAIKSFMEHDSVHIEIYEPWRNIFYLNKSKLNGPDHLLGHYYTFAVIDVKITSTFPESIMDVIEEFKPAGVKVHLTYRPGSQNPNADIPELPLQSSEIKNVETSLKIMNGLDDRVRGHVNLTNRARGDDDTSGLFITNKSRLNSKDRMAGSLSAGRSTYHLAIYSDTDAVFGAGTEMGDIPEITSRRSLGVTGSASYDHKVSGAMTGDVGSFFEIMGFDVSEFLRETPPVSPDFYTRTGKLDNQYASRDIKKGEESYLYAILDIATYLDIEYPRIMREIEPSGIYTKDTYLQLLDDVSLHYKIKAQLPDTAPAKIRIQIYDLEEGLWEGISQEVISTSPTENREELEEVERYLSDTGLLYIRLVFPQGHKDSYSFHLHFMELGFKKDIATRTTINYAYNVTGNSEVL